jgi:hypothetical protein
MRQRERLCQRWPQCDCIMRGTERDCEPRPMTAAALKEYAEREQRRIQREQDTAHLATWIEIV